NPDATPNCPTSTGPRPGPSSHERWKMRHRRGRRSPGSVGNAATTKKGPSPTRTLAHSWPATASTSTHTSPPPTMRRRWSRPENWGIRWWSRPTTPTCGCVRVERSSARTYVPLKTCVAPFSHCRTASVTRPMSWCNVWPPPVCRPSCGLADVTAELLDDRAFRLAPLTDMDAADLIHAVRAAPLLFGLPVGSTSLAEQPHVEALEELLIRVSRLVEAFPEIGYIDLDPV